MLEENPSKVASAEQRNPLMALGWFEEKKKEKKKQVTKEGETSRGGLDSHGIMA